MGSVQELNYICNYNFFIIAYKAKINFKSKTELAKIKSWVRKIMRSCATAHEMKLRNDFLYALASCVIKCDLDPPFDEPPPDEDLDKLACRLGIRDQSGCRSEKLTPQPNDPDIIEGSFLIAPPFPRIGAYCYVAALANPSK